MKRKNLKRKSAKRYPRRHGNKRELLKASNEAQKLQKKDCYFLGVGFPPDAKFYFRNFNFGGGIVSKQPAKFLIAEIKNGTVGCNLGVQKSKAHHSNQNLTPLGIVIRAIQFMTLFVWGVHT